jgi:hypothetical protein
VPGVEKLLFIAAHISCDEDSGCIYPNTSLMLVLLTSLMQRAEWKFISYHESS